MDSSLSVDIIDEGLFHFFNKGGWDDLQAAPNPNL